MKRIDGTHGFYALKHDLPALADRPNHDTVCALDRWILWLPGYHAMWSCYVLVACHLRNLPGVTPAVKHFPEATHEISLWANDPERVQVALEKGGFAPLEPANYVKQIILRDDAACNRLAEDIAVEFINARLLPEPQGIRGAREMFDEFVDRLVAL